MSIGTFREWLREGELNEVFNSNEFIKWATEYFNKKVASNVYTELSVGDKNMLELKYESDRPLLILNLKNGNITNPSDKTHDKQMYEMGERILKSMQSDYWYELGSISDANKIKEILKDAANIIDIEKGKRGIAIFRTQDGWYTIYHHGLIEKYDARKNIDPKIKKSIEAEWKKYKPDLKWYFKF